MFLVSLLAPQSREVEGDYGQIVLGGTVTHHTYPHLSLSGIKKESEYQIDLTIENRDNNTIRLDRIETYFYSPQGELSTFHMRHVPVNEMGEASTIVLSPFSSQSGISFLTSSHTKELIENTGGEEIVMTVKLFRNGKLTNSFNTTIPAITNNKNNTPTNAVLKAGESKKMIFIQSV